MLHVPDELQMIFINFALDDLNKKPKPFEKMAYLLGY
jgi:predicted lactoylglutathione lyase